MSDASSSANLTDLRSAAAQASGLLRLLANEDRLMLLCQLTQGEQNVSALEDLTGIRQPTLSQQLGVLRNEQVVETRRDGKQIYYRLCNQQVEALLMTLYALFCPAPRQPGARPEAAKTRAKVSSVS
ncbi:MAG: winged helix-turn-helix transcriptional regulator [Betaproteobacteria bacterium]|nr:winged helix-turn-helix transcriptional regulator [Betaproteobacteria bacterium]